MHHIFAHVLQKVYKKSNLDTTPTILIRTQTKFDNEILDVNFKYMEKLNYYPFFRASVRGFSRPSIHYIHCGKLLKKVTSKFGI